VPAVTALSSGLRVQEVAWSGDLNPAKPPELEQVMVTGDDRLGSGGEGAFEDSLVAAPATRPGKREGNCI